MELKLVLKNTEHIEQGGMKRQDSPTYMNKITCEIELNIQQYIDFLKNIKEGGIEVRTNE